MNAIKKGEGRPKLAPPLEIEEVNIKFSRAGLPRVSIKGKVLVAQRAYRSTSDFNMEMPLSPEISQSLQRKLAYFIVDTEAVLEAINELERRFGSSKVKYVEHYKDEDDENE